MDLYDSFNQIRAKWAMESGIRCVTVCRKEFLNGQVLKRRTGNLVNRIFSRLTPERDGFEFGTSVGYGIAWELGWDKETIIVPKNKKALAWPIGQRTNKSGKVIRGPKGRIYAFSKRVVLPAQKPRPFLRPTLHKLQGVFTVTAEKAYQGWMDKALKERYVIPV